MLEIKDLHVEVGGKEILKGINLVIQPGEVHAVMGPNGSGKSTLSYVLAGRPGYEVTGGSILYKGKDLTELEPNERTAAGVFLAFQYPTEVPGVTTMTFLKTALNAVRVARGEDELDAVRFLKLVRGKAKDLNITDDMLKRPLNVGFSGGEKKKAEILQMLMLEPKLAILDETDSGLDVDAVRTVSEGVRLFRERTHGSLLIITHSTRILEALHVDAAHVMEEGVIVRNGGAELVDEINEKGFSSLKED